MREHLPLWHQVHVYLSSLVLRGSDLARAEASASLPLTSAVLAGGLFCGFKKLCTCCSALRRSCSCCSFNNCADVAPPGPGIADPVDPTPPNEWPSPDPVPRCPTCGGFDVPDVGKFLPTSTASHQRHSTANNSLYLYLLIFSQLLKFYPTMTTTDTQLHQRIDK